jgi:hypothetical protein
MNQSFFRSVIIALALSGFFAASSLARLVEIWPYEKLLAESDTVAIVEASENRPAKDEFPNKPARYSAKDFEATDTRFKVHAVFKGQPKNSQDLTVLHFAYSKHATNMVNDAMFIRFPIEERMLKAAFGPDTRATGKVYLAFLKRRADGRLEPIRGHYDSALSFRELHETYP